MLGQVAHALDVGCDMQRGHHEAKVAGHRCLPGHQRVYLFLDLTVEIVDRPRRR